MKLCTLKLEASVSVACEHWIVMPEVPPSTGFTALVQTALQRLLFCLLLCLQLGLLTPKWLRAWVLELGGADSLLCDFEQVTKLL